ncbi:transcriptional regulator GlxA family with amidase domain [Kitasatospora paracochleata]|uniref:Transcriptional regulator GlxA family with amidase domain n=2 Tax=Kitasatospora paracochleata TaxID=58354 RepID=A0ABT1IYZ9_9ACTN|nr:transcriptional regulator GlxA family with amidase domain [Kitasatospora paracochleata]
MAVGAGGPAFAAPGGAPGAQLGAHLGAQLAGPTAGLTHGQSGGVPAAASGLTGPGAPAAGAPLSMPAPRKLSGRRRRETVAVLLFSGAPIFESSIPLSVFGVDRQDAGVPRYRLLVCGGEEGPLTTTGGLTLTAPYGLEALARAGTIVVPAWRSISQPPPVEAIAALRKAHHEGARIIGLCTGAFVLAAAGLLDGRPATTHWMYAPTLAKRYPRVHVDPRELFVDDGDVLTSAGTAAGIDLCLHVVRSDHGAEAANALARRLVVPNRRSGGGQAQYIDQSLPEEIGNDPLAEVVTWALENLNQQFDVEVLAARAYMSRRTFDRRFRTLTGSAPLQWLITQRVLQAQRLLETSDLSVDDVARRCGFRSPVALRGHFRRQLGVSPAAYRTNYRARRPAAPVATVPSQAVPGDRTAVAVGAGYGAGPGGPAGGHPHPGGAVPAHASGSHGGQHPGQHLGAHPGPHPGDRPGVQHPAGQHPLAQYQGVPHPSGPGPVGGPSTGAAPGPQAGARQRTRPLVPPQGGPGAGRPVRPGGRPGERVPERGVEHAIADEYGADQPGVRGPGLGHRSERPGHDTPGTAPARGAGAGGPATGSAGGHPTGPAAGAGTPDQGARGGAGRATNAPDAADGGAAAEPADQAQRGRGTRAVSASRDRAVG